MKNLVNGMGIFIIVRLTSLVVGGDTLLCHRMPDHTRGRHTLVVMEAKMEVGANGEEVKRREDK